MSRVVAVHGIGQQMKGPNTIHASWLPAMRDGLERAGHFDFQAADLAIAFYGDLFRPRIGKTLGDPPYVPADLDPDIEHPLLDILAEELNSVEPARDGGEAATAKGRTSQSAQRTLLRLLRSRYFAGASERLLIADLKQVGIYMKNAEVRSAIRGRLQAAITDDTIVLVGHSLGSVIAYEVLAANRPTSITTLITLGSPLGIPNLIFERLDPSPKDGRGIWPSGLCTWVNVADDGDPVALQKSLAPLFGNRVRDERIYNGATAHDARPYFTAIETGAALSTALAENT